MLSYKKLYRDEFSYEKLDFIKDTRNHDYNMVRVFHNKKITRVEQESWFYDVYCRDERLNIWVIKEESFNCYVGYLKVIIDSIIHQRVDLGLFIAPEFYESKYENKILNNFILYLPEKLRLYIHKVQSRFLIDDCFIDKFKKSGFEEEAVLKGHVFKEGNWRDIKILSKFIETQ